ncbi:Pantothenate kinase type III, CoaX-like [hydrothermal vent metagenome]|uniref:Type III pantothenate kinase n=1 Tax=hydrothermal vent metagenome TaxID=652676 RepID=A0A3B1AGD2_9ZZZZ
MSNPTRLLIDAGNSRIKWTFVESQSQLGTVISNVDLSSAIDAWPLLKKPDQVWLASVRDEQFGQELNAAIKSLWDLPVNVICSSKKALGVTNAYAEPQTLGCDRWAAMLAAYHESKRSLLVVNLGTALTIDAVDAEGHHLGGLISPGIHLQQEAIYVGTNIDCIPDISTFDSQELFAPSTAEGIVSGSINTISALIDRACQNRIKQDPDTLCYLAGGDAEKIKDTLQCPCIIEPSLVLKGIALIAAAE